MANAFRLPLHGFAYNLVNLFRRQLPPAWRSAQIDTPPWTVLQKFSAAARVWDNRHSTAIPTWFQFGTRHSAQFFFPALVALSSRIISLLVRTCCILVQTR